MIDISCEKPEICVIGRLDFNTGIGAVCYSACELLSRFFPVSIYPTNVHNMPANFVTLPNGRMIPICKNLSAAKVYFYTDVLWNGEYDLNYSVIPSNGLRIAQIAYDSDELPPQWVEILNRRFDVAYFTSHHLEDVAKRSGVKIPVGTLPVGLDLEPLLSRPYQQNRDKVRFGSLAAFHPRKGVELLVDAFIAEFHDEENVELLLHSNLSIGTCYNNILKKIELSHNKNIILSNNNLDLTTKNELIESFDIFTNCSQGEGYSIGPREALALGKNLVLSQIGPHNDLIGIQGVFGIPAALVVPARYPEIDNQIFGHQYAVTVPEIRRNLRLAYDEFKNNQTRESIRIRRKRASEFSFYKLALNYAETITPDLSKFKILSERSAFTHIPDGAQNIARQKIGAFGSELAVINRTVVPAHDGGFFSVFNAFMSHLVCDMGEDRCHMVLPDWDVSRLLEHYQDNKLVSFCYGRPQDGNIWLKLFEPLYGLSTEQMNDKDFLYQRSSLPKTTWNQHREPLLTYVHAYDLYISPTFKYFRQQYNKIFKEHIHLLPNLQQEIDDFCDKNFRNKYMIAAHIKHPSHMIEQPGMCIAHSQSFIDAINKKIASENLSPDFDNWGIYLATDQDIVVQQFKDFFGDRVSYFTDVRRTHVSEDEVYNNLSESAKANEGFQVQHLVAATPEQWSTRMAWEVIRDAMVMANAQVLFHVVSNVSTAVSYMNPDVELIFMQSDGNA